MAETDLSDRQRQALTLLRSGLSPAAAARVMGVTRSRMNEFKHLIEDHGVEVPRYVKPAPPPKVPKPRPRPPMTDGDRQVLAMMRKGMQQIEIAEQMGVGKARIGQRVKRLRDVYGFKDI